LFTAVAVAQMFVWALKKHRRYRKEFGSDYPRNRKAMFPFLA
jgi:very-long-chain enoyl-CoA reductase